MKVALQSEFTNITTEMTMAFIPAIINYRIYKQGGIEQNRPFSFKKFYSENLPELIASQVKKESKIVHNKSKLLQLSQNEFLGIRSKLDTHKWFLLKDDLEITYCLLVDRKVCEKFEQKLFRKIRGKVQEMFLELTNDIEQDQCESLYTLEEVFEDINCYAVDNNLSSFLNES